MWICSDWHRQNPALKLELLGATVMPPSMMPPSVMPLSRKLLPVTLNRFNEIILDIPQSIFM